MTAPNGPANFEYSDDSVVARLSFDVPPQALTDVTQLTQALAAMAIQQDYVARASGTWLDYMQQVPQIMERANQAYRESITQMERMAYLQNEMGGGQANVGPSTGDPSSGQAYSTAAGAGYVNPFMGMQFGMGVTPDLTSAQQHMQGMAMQNPQMYANFMGARGMAVNPALMGMMGGAVAGATGMGGQGGSGGGQGWGAAPPGAMNSQGTQSSRDAAAPPDPAQGGASTRSEPQNLPADPHPDSPSWVRTATERMNEAHRYMNETGATGGGRASTALALGSLGLGALGRYASSRGGDEGGGMLAGLGSKLGGFGKAAGVAGLAAASMGLVQRGGEQIQEYQSLGAVQGGDWMTGIGYEATARLNALDPFINTEQQRQMMQMALSAGFRGGDFDEMVDSMKANYKEFGLQFAQTMNMNMLSQFGGETALEARTGNEATLATMSALSNSGGASMPTRAQQLEDVMQQAISQGASPESARRAALGYQEGYGDNMALRESIGRIGGQVNSSPLLLQMAANQAGIGGDLLPGALAAGLSEAGMDQDEIMESAAKQVADMVTGYPNRLNRIAAFQDLMGRQGVNLSWPEAEGLYDKVTGEEKPSEHANKRVADMAQPKSAWTVAGDLFKAPFGAIGNVWNAAGNALTGNFSEAWDDLNSGPSFGGESQDQKTADQFAAAGRAPRKPPETPQQVQQQTVNTQGIVQGEVRITVDQNGRVSAPQSIQLSGQQKSANAGYSNAQLNNAPPGDPSFGHSANGWGDR